MKRWTCKNHGVLSWHDGGWFAVGLFEFNSRDEMTP